MSYYSFTSEPCLGEVDLLMFGGMLPTERETHTGVFTGCKGDINVEYLGEKITTADIEDVILSEYRFRDIGFVTWQEFQQEFVNVWNRYFPVLADNLAHVEEFTVIDSKETITGNSTIKSKTGRTGSSNSRFSNTPNQLVPDSFEGLTSYSEAQGTEDVETESGTGSQTEIDRGGNAFERWLELSDKNRNLVYFFVDKFNNLFINTYTITRRI